MITITTKRPRRRPRPAAGLEQLARRLARGTSRNGILDPSAGRDADPKTPIRRALRGLWRNYYRILHRKDRAAALLRDAGTPAEQVRLAEEIARHDHDLADLDMVLAHLEDRLRPLAPTLST